MTERPRLRSEASGHLPRPVSLEDAELVEQVKAGHSEAYGELVERYQDRVFNACWRVCGHLEDARDLTQEAFLKAYEHIASFREHSGFYTWIFRVAVNLAISHRRKQAKRRALSLDQASGEMGTQAVELARQVKDARADDPARAASDAELQQGLLRVLNSLDEDHRAVVVLRDIEGMDYREIGEILDIRPGTVRSRLHRARVALRAAVVTPSSNRQ